MGDGRRDEAPPAFRGERGVGHFTAHLTDADLAALDRLLAKLPGGGGDFRRRR